jgi:signal transduction histidine kinase
MTSLEWFPFPIAVDGARRDGSLWEWPAACHRCEARPCEKVPPGNAIQLCSWGINFAKPSKDVTIGGLVLKDWTNLTQARTKRIRECGNDGPTIAMLQGAVDELIFGLRTREAEESDQAAKEARQAFLQEQHRLGFLDAFRSDIETALSSFHDYRQINTQIIQLANLLIEREQGAQFEEKLGSVDPVILAIYEASRFLDEKLTVATLLVDRSWLSDARDCVRFRVHGMVHKYAQIHRARAMRKGVSITVDGVSYREVHGNPRAAGVVMHTLLDNAVKYSPAQQAIRVALVEADDGSVGVKVTSVGPRIHEHEREQIFNPFFRGEKAKEFSDEGSGYGLYVSQLIAREHFGTEITVRQRQDDRARGLYETTFSWLVPAVSKVGRA